MASHRFHSDTHEKGLADDCARCEQIASTLFTALTQNGTPQLDKRNFSMLVERVFQQMEPRSDNERIAMSAVVRWAIWKLRTEFYVDEILERIVT